MGTSPDNPLKRFIREIHRRSLWQVLGIYVVASWVVLQVVETLGGLVALPEWFGGLAIGLLVLGLPIVLATAFVQEGGSRGGGDGPLPGRAAGLETPPPPTLRLFTWHNALLGGLGAFALLGILGTGWVLFGGSVGDAEHPDRSPSSVDPSIAVLPFEDLSPEGDQEYFVQGLSEEIINVLTRVPEMKVSARTSTFLLAEQDADIATVASTLGVANVLEGSVRKAGERIRITAQLIEAESGFHLWSETFERDLTDVFEVQDAIARAIAERMQVTLAGGAGSALVAEATESPEAHEAYLRGRHLWNQRVLENYRPAIQEFRRAIELDPEYAEAWSGLADAYLLLGIDRMDRATREAGLRAARRAVELAPNLGMAHASLGFGRFLHGDWHAAERAFERALVLNPGYATAHRWYSLFLQGMGRFSESVDHAEQALQLDPVSQSIGGAWSAAGRLDEAVDRYRESTAMHPDWGRPWYYFSRTLFEAERYDEGLEAWLRAARLYRAEDLDVAEEAYRAMVRYHRTGEPQTTSEWPESRPASMPDFRLIWFYAHTGQTERALDRFEVLVREGPVGFAALNHVDFLGSLMGDEPRYQALLEDIGITW